MRLSADDFINGITWLRTLEYQQNTPGINTLTIVSAVMLVVCFCLFMYWAMHDHIYVAILMLVVTCILFITTFLFAEFGNTTTVYRYEVLIDDGVSMTEFNELYELVDHHDNIYEIAVKEIE